MAEIGVVITSRESVTLVLFVCTLQSVSCELLLNLALAPSSVKVGHLLKINCVHSIYVECAQLSFNKCPIYTQDDASAKFSTSSSETDNSVGLTCV